MQPGRQHHKPPEDAEREGQRQTREGCWRRGVERVTVPGAKLRERTRLRPHGNRAGPPCEPVRVDCRVAATQGLASRPTLVALFS
jgi:hypothetical protein